MSTPSLSAEAVMGSTVFVTGGTGLVGRHAVSALLRAGCRVTMLVRRAPADAPRAGVRVVIGDLQRFSEFAHHLRGHDAVLHASGSVDTPRAGPALRTVLVDGTRDLLAAAEREGVRRIVHVSSLSVLEPARNGRWGPESPMRRTPAGLPDYVRAKFEAETVVAAARARGALEVVVVRPGVVVGEGDRTTTPRVLRVLAHSFAFGIGAGENAIPCVVAEELGEALARAATRSGLAGLHANLSSRERVTQRMLLEWHAEAAGLPLPRVRLTRSLAEKVAPLIETAYRLAGALPPLTRLAVAVATVDVRVDAGEPEARLGWRGTASCRDAVHRAVTFTLASAGVRERSRMQPWLRASHSGGRP